MNLRKIVLAAGVVLGTISLVLAGNPYDGSEHATSITVTNIIVSSNATSLTVSPNTIRLELANANGLSNVEVGASSSVSATSLVSATSDIGFTNIAAAKEVIWTKGAVIPNITLWFATAGSTNLVLTNTIKATQWTQ